MAIFPASDKKDASCQRPLQHQRGFEQIHLLNLLFLSRDLCCSTPGSSTALFTITLCCRKKFSSDQRIKIFNFCFINCVYLSD